MIDHVLDQIYEIEPIRIWFEFFLKNIKANLDKNLFFKKFHPCHFNLKKMMKLNSV